MARLVLRTKPENASYGSGSGASFLPWLVTPPCPNVPWHCQQPYFMYAALPFSAEAAIAAPWLISAAATPTAAASDNSFKPMFAIPRSARLRPHVDQRGLARLHDLDRALQRSRKVGRILDRSRRPPAHRRRQLGV